GDLVGLVFVDRYVMQRVGGAGRGLLPYTSLFRSGDGGAVERQRAQRIDRDGALEVGHRGGLIERQRAGAGDLDGLVVVDRHVMQGVGGARRGQLPQHFQDAVCDGGAVERQRAQRI